MQPQAFQMNEHIEWNRRNCDIFSFNLNFNATKIDISFFYIKI